MRICKIINTYTGKHIPNTCSSPLLKMIPNPTKWNKKFWAMWESCICKIIESCRHWKTLCQGISPDPCICCRAFPACENICEEHAKITCEKTILWKKVFLIPIEILESSGWRKINVATINSHKTSLKERPQFAIIVDMRRNEIIRSWTLNMLVVKRLRWKDNGHLPEVSSINFLDCCVNDHNHRNLLGDGPICSLKSLSNMMNGQTSNRCVEEYGKLFLKCHISGIPMAHWL